MANRFFSRKRERGRGRAGVGGVGLNKWFQYLRHIFSCSAQIHTIINLWDALLPCSDLTVRNLRSTEKRLCIHSHFLNVVDMKQVRTDFNNNNNVYITKNWSKHNNTVPNTIIYGMLQWYFTYQRTVSRALAGLLFLFSGLVGSLVLISLALGMRTVRNEEPY